MAFSSLSTLGGGGSDLGTLAKASYQMVLERALGIRNQSSPVLRLSHSSVRWRTGHVGRAR